MAIPLVLMLSKRKESGAGDATVVAMRVVASHPPHEGAMQISARCILARQSWAPTAVFLVRIRQLDYSRTACIILHKTRKWLLPCVLRGLSNG